MAPKSDEVQNESLGVREVREVVLVVVDAPAPEVVPAVVVVLDPVAASPLRQRGSQRHYFHKLPPYNHLPSWADWKHYYYW